ncbi:sensor histidine kinase [Microscilla marina]|uniref:Signal transduction ATPase, FimS family n=1 Tax=Microscilla marina ATCC 23134 TaxID=313606 RepID=A1ZD67_MICM2|nr:histidine kinase [Microscilla marina]EAY31606.1 signal transduction ATPase, FimS family [Microscilla marina ATCC 23134]
MKKDSFLKLKFIATPLKYWWLFIGFFFVVGFFLGLNNKIYFSYIDKKASLFELMWPEVLEWVIWGVLCPFIIILAKKHAKNSSSGWLSKVKFHVPVAILTSFLYAVIYAYLRCAIGFLLNEEFLWSFSRNFMYRLFYLPIPLILYSSIVGMTYAVSYYQQFKDEALKAAEIQQKLAQAELLVLKKQLQPHFLFNTLHAISTLMHKDIDAADKMIVRLSHLLRATLENTGIQEVTLKQEMEILKIYLEIEQIRFQDRLEVSIEVDPAIYDKKVPNLILQPIVENAIRYGVAQFAKQGKIAVVAQQVNGHVELKVVDNGKGMPSTQVADIKEGVGLTNTRMRLQQLYGDKGQLILNNVGQNEGLEVKVLIPA